MTPRFVSTKCRRRTGQGRQTFRNAELWADANWGSAVARLALGHLTSDNTTLFLSSERKGPNTFHHCRLLPRTRVFRPELGFGHHIDSLLSVCTTSPFYARMRTLRYPDNSFTHLHSAIISKATFSTLRRPLKPGAFARCLATWKYCGSAEHP